MKTKIAGIFLLFILFSVCLSKGLNAHSAHISASGCSVSNTGYLSDIAKEYERRTGVQVLVRGGGSLAGLEDLRSGKVDFAASCRNKMADDPEDIEFIQVAWDALVFIVHKSNPVNDITPDEVRTIHEGRTTNWKQLRGSDLPLQLFVSKPQKGLSGVYSSTKEMVLKGKETVRGFHVLALASTGIVEQMVEKTAGGFGTTGYSSARKRDVKMLKVNGVKPSKETIIKNKYPFRRPLFILANRKPKPEVKKFIDFILSKEGQQFISSLGAISMLDVK